MTAAAGADALVAPAPAAPQRRTLRPDRASWPIWLCTAGMPLSYLLGVQGFVWCLPAVVLGFRLLRSPRTWVPRSVVPLLLFLAWVPLSFSLLGPSNLSIFLYRWSLFGGCLTCVVWLVNVDEEKVPTERIVDWLAALWIALVAFGYLAQVLPTVNVRSPFAMALGPIGKIDFIARMSDWKLADYQELVNRRIARPAAPFGAANSWGSAVGLLTPFFIRSWIVGADRRRRRIGFALLAAAVLPIITSVNRGLWISLGVALVYFAARKALRGRFGPTAVLVVALAAVAVVLVATPAGRVVQDRLSSAGESNESRGSLYEDAWHGARESPLIGNGAPRATDYYENSPPVGTHGLIWYLMFCHGFVGLALFLGWLVGEVARSGRVRTSMAWWTHLSIVIALVQVPYYGLLPHVVLVGIAVGLAHRDARAARAPAAPTN